MITNIGFYFYSVMNTLMQMGPMMVMEGPNGMHQAFPQPSQHIQQQPPITSNVAYVVAVSVSRADSAPIAKIAHNSADQASRNRVVSERQRDAPTFKARVGCNQCEDCRMPDCQICLVCLDKRFFENRYMTGAMCAKKRCNNATSIELPAQSPQSMHDFQQRQAQKRAYDQGAPPPIHFEMKRRGMEVNYGMSMSQLQGHQQQVPQSLGHPHAQQNARILAINPAVNYEITPNGDPFIPPSYAPEMKNAVVLQPL
ncbi:CXXC zinc finger domain protein [Cooperia oncophora]